MRKRENGSVTLIEAAIVASLGLIMLLAVTKFRSAMGSADQYDRCLATADAAAMARPDFDRTKCP